MMNFPSFHAAAVAEFHPAPSVDEISATKIRVAKSAPKNAGAIGVPVGTEGDVPSELGLDRATLVTAGFEGKSGQTLIVPRPVAAPVIRLIVASCDDIPPTGVSDANAVPFA